MTNKTARKRRKMPDSYNAPWTDAMKDAVEVAHRRNMPISDIAVMLNARFPDKQFAYQNVRQHMVRMGYFEIAPVLGPSEPVKPLSVEEWQWGVDGYQSWSRPDLDLEGALYLTRPAKMGSHTYGFYVMVSGNDRAVPVWQAMKRGQMSFEDARAAALTYLSAFKDGLPPSVAETLRQRSETEKSRFRRYSRDHNRSGRFAAKVRADA